MIPLPLLFALVVLATPDSAAVTNATNRHDTQVQHLASNIGARARLGADTLYIEQQYKNRALQNDTGNAEALGSETQNRRSGLNFDHGRGAASSLQKQQHRHLSTDQAAQTAGNDETNVDLDKNHQRRVPYIDPAGDQGIESKVVVVSSN